MNAVNPLSPEMAEVLNHAGEPVQASPIDPAINTETAAELNPLPESEQSMESNQGPAPDQTTAPVAEPDTKPKDTKPNFPAAPLQYRYLLTEIGQHQLAFPLRWVSELILVEPSHILALPFYDPMLLGVLQYKGDVVPLVAAPLQSKAETVTAAQRLKTKRRLTAVRLNRSVGKLAGVGLMVDRVIERFASVSQTEFPSQVRIFQIEDISPSIWQPR